MQTIRVLPLVVIHLFYFINFLSAQTPQDSLEKEINTIRHLPMSTLLRELDEKESTYDRWLYHDILRHEVIKKLDSIFEYDYHKWIDFDEFMSYVDEVKTRKITEEIKEFKKIAGDSIYQQLENNPTDSIAIQQSLKKIWREKRDSLFFRRWDLLFTWLQFDRNIYEQPVIEANVSFLGNHTTLQYLSYVYQDSIGRAKYDTISNSIKSRNFELIRDRVAEVEAATFLHYRSNETDRKVIKEIDFYMDNDVFTLGGLNQDRNYTGGGALTISTDYLESKWLNPEWLFISKEKLKKPRRVMMSYQSLSLGMHFFTPYVRYRDNFALADTLFQHDRPFGSFVYLDRSKYRLWPKGLIRHHSALQVGIIGSNAGKNIQAILHRDATVQSQKVYGWDNQIANGGRWLVQFNQTVDLLLYSGTNKYQSIFSNTKNDSPKNFGWNVVGTGEIMVGGFLTALGGGLKLASSDFTKQSGQKSIKPFKNNIYNFGIYLDAGISYRYVVHNSMLEGFGYLTTFTDDLYDDESESVYTLNQAYYEMQNEILGDDKKRYARTPSEVDEVERHLFLIDFGINIRWRKMTVYGHITYHNKEFTAMEVDYEGLLPLVKPEDIDFYQEEAITDLETYNDNTFYGYGKLGVTWLLGE